ncbi:hypothetical protein [Streptomyces sp. NPDC001530]|uniref:hypothetical protein n=1 Tax=Streptomyces sp. NPDC001530 TaxID=3364582 RepID=UPI0036A861C0
MGCGARGASACLAQAVHQPLQVVVEGFNRDAFKGPSAVLFQVELSFEGVVDRLDQLTDLLEHRFAEALPIPLERRPQQLDTKLGEVLLERPG